MARLRAVAPVLVAVLLSTACGSTVQSGGTGAASLSSGVGQDGLGDSGLEVDGMDGGERGADDASPLAGPSTADGADGSSDAPGTSSAGGGPGQVTAPGGSGEVSGGGQPVGSTGRPQSPSGPVKIGFVTTEGAEAYFSALGAKTSAGDQRNQIDALVDYLNKRGGLMGRRIQPVIHDRGTGDPEAEGAAACAYFTQDNPVFAVIDPTGGSTGYVRCLAKAGVILVAGYNAQSESVVRQTAGRYFAPPELTPERFAREYIKQLAALKFYSPDAKIGLLTFDTPEMKELTERIIKPALAAHGLRLHDQAAFDQTQFASQGPSFAFRFKANDVTHVLNLSAGAIVFFQQAAEQQQYRPRYALSSRDGPGAWVQLLAPAAQLRGSIGIGWQPTADVDLQHTPGDVSPNHTLCRRLMQEAGEDMSNQLVQVASHRYCEGVFFLSSVAARMTQFSPAAFTAAASSMGTAHQPVLTFRSYFAQDRVDGADQFRALIYQDACSCFVYSGPLRDLART